MSATPDHSQDSQADIFGEDENDNISGLPNLGVRSNSTAGHIYQSSYDMAMDNTLASFSAPPVIVTPLALSNMTKLVTVCNAIISNLCQYTLSVYHFSILCYTFF